MARLLLLLMLAGCEATCTRTVTSAQPPDASNRRQADVDRDCGPVVIDGRPCIVCRFYREMALSCDWTSNARAR